MTSALLAATDFSAHARHAVLRAALLARETGAPLVLLHVQPGDAIEQLRQWLGVGSEPERQMMDTQRAQLEQLAVDIRQDHRLTVTSACRSGAVLDEVLREADERDAGLLVIGARGTGFLRRLMLGTTAERLMRRSPRPLLLVRQRPHEPYRRVLVAVDFSPWSVQAVAAARRVAPHAALTLMTVFQVPFEEKLRFAGVDEATVRHYRERSRSDARQRLHALAERCGLTPGAWTACVVEGDASLRIVEQEQEFGCDLVVLGKHGQSAAEDLLLGSVTRHVLDEGSADVLVSTAHEAAAPPT